MKSKEELDAYLAKIRKTIADSRALVAQAELRFAETDRFLESQGLTREQVMAMHFSEAQIESVNAELRRRGLDPLERWALAGEEPPAETPPPQPDEPPSTDAELENRQRKFGMMMKPFQL